MKENIKKFDEKKFGATLSVASNSTLILIKLIAGVISGSISVLSEALHSLVDLLASALTYFSITKSQEPEDDGHPFGHGKYEDLGGFIEALLIILTGVGILYFAGEKIIFVGKNHTVETELGIIVMAISVVANIFVSSYLKKVANKTDSIALMGDSEHLRADVFSSLGIICGLFAVKLTGLTILDPLIAIITGTIILKSGIKLTKKSSTNLLDGSLPAEDKNQIMSVLKDFEAHGVIGTKNVRTSKSGAKRLIQMVILLPSGINLLQAHNICDAIEQEIRERLKNCDIIIHAEPYCKSEIAAQKM